MAARPLQLSPWQRKVAGLVQSVETLNSLILAGGRSHYSPTVSHRVEPASLPERLHYRQLLTDSSSALL